MSIEQKAHDLDRDDVLARFRRRFFIPTDTIYLDGNSLGLMSRDAERAVRRVLEQWKQEVIGGYSLPRPDSWYYMGEELGAMMAPLIGATPDEVVATGTNTVNLHALLATFYEPQETRRKIVATALDFPTDIYALNSQIALRGGDPERDLVRVRSPDGRLILEKDIIKALDDTVAVALLPSVLYRSGQLLDLARLTTAAHSAGALIGFDCSHSVGAVPHQLHEKGVDFAVWCGYKYLNAGPGAPGALYVHRRHHRRLPALAGWWGNDKATQFDMSHDFQPSGDAGAWQISSNPQLSAAPLRASLKMFHEAGIERVRQKSLAMTEYLMELIDQISGPPYEYHIGNPREPKHRGGHVAIEHAEAARICKALKARGVVPDYRMPDVIRLAPVALYNTFHECWRTVQHLKAIIDTKEFEKFPDGRDLIA